METRFFRESIAPGYLLYEEYLAATLPAGATAQVEIRTKVRLRIVLCRKSCLSQFTFHERVRYETCKEIGIKRS